MAAQALDHKVGNETFIMEGNYHKFFFVGGMVRHSSAYRPILGVPYYTDTEQ